MHHRKNRSASGNAFGVLEGHFEPKRLAAVELFILCGCVGGQRNRPSARTAEYTFTRVIGIVLYSVHLGRQARAKLADRRPPEIVISPQKQDTPRHLCDFAQIAERIAQEISPGISTISSSRTRLCQSAQIRSKWCSQCAPKTSIGFLSPPGRCKSPIANMLTVYLAGDNQESSSSSSSSSTSSSSASSSSRSSSSASSSSTSSRSSSRSSTSKSSSLTSASSSSSSST